MATLTVVAANNVTVTQIGDTTAGTEPNTFTVNSNGPTHGTAFAGSSNSLTVQLGLSNARGDHDRSTITVTDSYGSGSFLGVANIEWAQGDDGILWTQFANFPMKSDQATPMDKCDYSISVVNLDDANSGTSISATVYTL